MEKVKKVISVILSILLWAVILLAVLFTITTLVRKDENKVSNVFGFTPLTVESGSMSPTFDEGDLIIIKTCDTSTLKEGDIITFHTIISGEIVLNTHRIESITETGGIRIYSTKGDNNELADSRQIQDSDIVGKYVCRLKNMGKVMNFLSSSVGFLVVIILPMFLFFIYQIYHLVVVGNKLKVANETRRREQNESELEKARLEADDMRSQLEALKAETEALKAEQARLRENGGAIQNHENDNRDENPDKEQ